MGLEPVLARQPDFPRDVLGRASARYFGGWAECRVRKRDVPVVYCDFRSMYPTVNALLDFWRSPTASRLRVVHATDGVRRFLDRVRSLSASCTDAPAGDVRTITRPIGYSYG